MAYAMVTVVQGDDPADVHEAVIDSLQGMHDVLYIGRPIEVPDEHEYATDGVWLRCGSVLHRSQQFTQTRLGEEDL